MQKAHIPSKAMLMLVALSLFNNNLLSISIGELAQQEPRRIKITRGWVPGSRILDLSGTGITDLKGIEEVPGIEKVTRLYLDNNNIQTIEPGDLAAATKLQALGLSNNGLTTIESNAFAGLKNLKVLNLSHNHIESIPEGGLNGMPNLRFLAMSKNPMPNPKQDLQSQVPKAFITVLPITKDNVRKWISIIGTAAAALIVTFLGVKAAVKKKRKKEPERRPIEPVSPASRPLLYTREESLPPRTTPVQMPIDLPTTEELNRLDGEGLKRHRDILTDYLMRAPKSGASLYDEWERNLEIQMNKLRTSLEALDTSEALSPEIMPARPDITGLTGDPIALLSRVSGIELLPQSTVEDVEEAYNELNNKINNGQFTEPAKPAVREIESMFRTQAGRENWLAFAQGKYAVEGLALAEEHAEGIAIKIFEIQEKLQEE